jgi:DNA-binding NarL/FixJ family response regulator
MKPAPDACIIADDHPLFRLGLRQVAADILPDTAVIETTTADLPSCLAQAFPALLLYTLPVQDLPDWSSLRPVLDRHPEIDVVVVAETAKPAIVEDALRLGALGVLPKSLTAEEMKEALRAVLSGEIWTPPAAPSGLGRHRPKAQGAKWLSTLTQREREVLALVRQGKFNKQIAYELGITESTVKSHVSTVMEKLGVRKRTQAVLACFTLPEEV